MKKYSPSGSFVNQNAKCSEDEFDPLEKHKKRAETKAVFLDMEINSSSSDDSDCFLDSKAKLHSRKTINESNQSQKLLLHLRSTKKTNASVQLDITVNM